MVACNTSGDQYLVLGTSRENSLVDAIVRDTVPLRLHSKGAAIDKTSIIGRWWLILGSILDIIAPVGSMSLFEATVAHNNLTAIKFSYYGMGSRFL